MSQAITDDHRSSIEFRDVRTKEAVFREAPPHKLGRDEVERALKELSVTLELGYSVQSATQYTASIRTVLTPPTNAPVFAELTVTVEGIFGVAGDEYNQLLHEFIVEQAPLLLWPYARQAITNLTASTLLKGLILPPINMQRVVAAMRETAKEAST